jgi:hypothetical protein
MSTVGEITQIFNGPHSVPEGTNGYLDCYNGILSSLFGEPTFRVTSPKPNCLEVIVHVDKYCLGIYQPKTALLLVVLDEEHSEDEFVAAQNMMEKWLMEADTVKIRRIPGLCVCGSRVSLSTKNAIGRNEDYYSITGRSVGFDMDLKEEDGAACFLRVVEDIWRSCDQLAYKYERFKFRRYDGKRRAGDP